MNGFARLAGSLDGALAFTMLTGTSSAQVAGSATFDGAHVASAPPITGEVDDLRSPLWQQAFHVHDFKNYTTRGTPEDRTDAYLLFGPDAVYRAFVAVQRTASITATQVTDNVGVDLDDHVTLMFDTSGTGTNQYSFESTPAGVRTQQASESTRYAPAWTAVAHRFDHAWIAELTVPYRFLRGSSTTWR